MTTITIQNPTITSTTGVFGCDALSTPLLVGQPVTIAGTFSSGSIDGYVTGTTYYVIGTPTTTAFQLSATLGGTALTTTASTGAITGITITTQSKTAIVWMLPADISKPCQRALIMLTNKNYAITKKDIRDSANKTQFATSMPNAKTVPQVWIDGVYIGGVDELKAFLKL